MKNKTLAAWLALLAGPLGLHRFYLYGLGDKLGWLLPLPAAMGFYGVQRVRQYGVDDMPSWVLIPLLGFTLAACAGTAIYYGLMNPDKWNARFNTGYDAQAIAGQTGWLTIGAVVLSLLLGTTVLMASIVYSFQRYFEYQIEQARLISQ
ncbi:MAG: hypothetical protein ACKVIH_12220 [Burkholderiales bacterium]